MEPGGMIVEWMRRNLNGQVSEDELGRQVEEERKLK